MFSSLLEKAMLVPTIKHRHSPAPDLRPTGVILGIAAANQRAVSVIVVATSVADIDRIGYEPFNTLDDTAVGRSLIHLL